MIGVKVSTGGEPWTDLIQVHGDGALGVDDGSFATKLVDAADDADGLVDKVLEMLLVDARGCADAAHCC